MEKKDILLALIDNFAGGNKARFASILGITPQGISTWLKRNTFDIDLVFAKCEGINPRWLLTGEGPMMQGVQEYTPEPSDGIHEVGEYLRDERLAEVQRTVAGADGARQKQIIEAQRQQIAALEAQLAELREWRKLLTKMIQK